MKLIGLTGGIGSGKTTVAAFFGELGIPVYNSDRRARYLMEHRKDLRQAIIELLGPRAYTGEQLNTRYVARLVFSDGSLLSKLNALVHPEVRSDFEAWAKQQNAPYVLQEAAVLFENGGYKNLDRVILVTAPRPERIRRVVARDGSSAEDVTRRMNHQWPDSRKLELADFTIENSELASTQKQVLAIHRELLETSGSAGH